MNEQEHHDDAVAKKSASNKRRGMWATVIKLVESKAAYYGQKAQTADNPKAVPEGFAAKLTGWSTFAGAILAFIAALAFWFQFGAMKDANEASTNAFITGDRGWIASGAPIWQAIAPKKDGDLIAVAFIYANTGKSAVFDVRNVQNWFWVDPKQALITIGAVNVLDPTKLKFPANDTCKNISVRPIVDGASWPHTVDRTPGTAFGSTIPWPKAPPQFFQGRIVYAFHGCFSYSTYGQTHQTKYCEYLFPAPGIPPEKWGWMNCLGPDQNAAN